MCEIKSKGKDGTCRSLQQCGSLTCFWTTELYTIKEFNIDGHFSQNLFIVEESPRLSVDLRVKH